MDDVKYRSPTGRRSGDLSAPRVTLAGLPFGTPRKNSEEKHAWGS